MLYGYALLLLDKMRQVLDRSYMVSIIDRAIHNKKFNLDLNFETSINFKKERIATESCEIILIHKY